MSGLCITQLIKALLILSPICTHSFMQNVQIPSNNINNINNILYSQSQSQPTTDENANPVVPYVIQRIEANRKKDFEDLCKMTIQVFFNEEKDDTTTTTTTTIPQPTTTTPWKSMQLAYLRHLQYSDLRTRKYMSSGPQNDMFIARQVVTTNEERQLPAELELPKNMEINNEAELPPLKENEIYCLSDEVIGFVEVSARVFYLPNEYYKDKPTKQYRPILTNLAVKKEARRSGVGTALVNLCEDTVQNIWKPSYNDMVLQVEDDNPRGYWFYKKLGYEFVFSDPSTRRFDTSGFFLKEVRSTKVCMRKVLKEEVVQEKDKFFFADFVSGFRALREQVAN